MRRCVCRPLTNRLPLTAHGRRRFFARCPCARLLYMTNSGRFCWCGFGSHLTAVFWYIRLFADRQRFTLWQIIRKPDFRPLRIKVIPRRRFFFAGFLSPLDIGATALLLRCGCRCALRLFRFCPGAYIVRVLTWCIFFQCCRWCCRSRPFGLLDIGASGLFLRCGGWYALRLRLLRL